MSGGCHKKRLDIAIGIDEFVAGAKMNQYEIGRHTPDYSVLAQIAKVVKLPPAFFYTDDDVLAQLIRLYSQMGKRKQKLLLDTLVPD